MKDTKDIESHLAYSKKLSELTAGHQLETAQLLEDMKQLREDAHTLLNENERLQAELKEKDTRIEELKAKVAKLEARPTNLNIQADQYVENQSVSKQIIALRPTKRSKTKQIYNSNQLPLWDPNALL